MTNDKTREAIDFIENLLRDACMRIDAGYAVDIRGESIKIVRLIRNHDFMGGGATGDSVASCSSSVVEHREDSNQVSTEGREFESQPAFPPATMKKYLGEK